MKLIKCKDCVLLDKCPSGQRVTKLIEDFTRFCSVGMTEKEIICNHEWVSHGVTMITIASQTTPIGCYEYLLCEKCGKHLLKPYLTDKNGYIVRHY